MTRTTALAAALSILATFSVLPDAAALGPSEGGEDCQGDIEVQSDPYNHYGCEDCRGSIIIQAGHTNDVDCRGDSCVGNIIVQAGLDNSVNCATGILSTYASQSGMDAPPCPSQLPRDNYYCYLASRILPDEVCLSLDFCLWQHRAALS